MTAANGKHRFAMYWAASCGGCDIAVLNLHEAILDFAERFDIVFWPAVMDAKYRDVEAMPDGSIDLTLVSGSIRNAENAEIVRLLRRKSAILVAFGSCATEGCIPGLANLGTTAGLLDVVFDGPGTDNPDHLRPASRVAVPEGELHLPAMEPLVRTLDQVVEVDYRMPGCPPESERIAEVVGLLTAALDGKAGLPPRGSVVGAGHSTVCDECQRDRSAKRISEFRRIQQLPALDPGLCLLEQGLPCNGSATRDGCGAKCPLAGAPCIGCYGPADGVVEFGARLLSAFASVVDASEPEEIDRILDGLPDPVGQFYRFSLAGSLLRGARAARTATATRESAP
ncbi:MAG TPA: oxidoreductase [Candidatus Limnocylindria bacterium]